MRRFFAVLLIGSALAFSEPMTREAVEKRLALLEKDRLQVIANLNAMDGAIQDCKYWLDQFDSEKAHATKEVKPTAKPGHPPAAAKKE